MVVVDPIDQPHFRFIEMSMIGLVVGLSGAYSLAINGAILTGADVTVGFFGLPLW